MPKNKGKGGWRVLHILALICCLTCVLNPVSAATFSISLNCAACFTAGGKNRRRGKNTNDEEKRELVLKEEGQEYGQVRKLLASQQH